MVFVGVRVPYRHYANIGRKLNKLKMRKFEVELSKTVYITYHVEALDEDDAGEKALEMADEDAYDSSYFIFDYELCDVTEEKEVSHA